MKSKYIMMWGKRRRLSLIYSVSPFFFLTSSLVLLWPFEHPLSWDINKHSVSSYRAVTSFREEICFLALKTFNEDWVQNIEYKEQSFSTCSSSRCQQFFMEKILFGLQGFFVTMTMTCRKQGWVADPIQFYNKSMTFSHASQPVPCMTSRHIKSNQIKFYL